MPQRVQCVGAMCVNTLLGQLVVTGWMKQRPTARWRRLLFGCTWALTLTLRLVRRGAYACSYKEPTRAFLRLRWPTVPVHTSFILLAWPCCRQALEDSAAADKQLGAVGAASATRG